MLFKFKDFVARGNIQQISCILQTEQYLRFGHILLYLGM